MREMEDWSSGTDAQYKRADRLAREFITEGISNRWADEMYALPIQMRERAYQGIRSGSYRLKAREAVADREAEQ